MRKKISLGVVGFSTGNGHPYSWSAIINGFNRNALSSCPFPVIRDYLSNKDPNKKNFENVKVTHVWTQDVDISRKIAKFANIDNISEDLDSMALSVDGILLARDDYENHLENSKIFLRAGLPIYIDKPIAVNRVDLLKIINAQIYQGQIFSCSAVKNANEFQISKKEISSYGKIYEIHASAPKDWLKYSIHIIDPVIKIFKLDSDFKLLKKETDTKGNHSASFYWSRGLSVKFSTTGTDSPIFIKIVGDKVNKKIYFKDSYNAFKNTLELFIFSIKKKDSATNHDELALAVDIIERGNII